jgi:hypothetical protein
METVEWGKDELKERKVAAQKTEGASPVGSGSRLLSISTGRCYLIAA